MSGFACTFRKIGSNVAIQVMGEDLFSLGIVHARAIGGDHIRLIEVIADLPNINVVTSGGEDEVQADAVSSFNVSFAYGVKWWSGESKVPSKSDATTWYINGNLTSKQCGAGAELMMSMEKIDNGSGSATDRIASFSRIS